MPDRCFFLPNESDKSFFFFLIRVQVTVAPHIGPIQLKMFRFLLFVLNYDDVLVLGIMASKLEYGLANMPQI